MITTDAEQLTAAPRGPLRVACPKCAEGVGAWCMTTGGNRAESIHADRWSSYKSRIRSEWFVVRVLADDARLGVLAGERYEAQLYSLDPGKVSLLRRIPDGYDPQCNHYWGDVEFEGWGRDSR